MMDRIALTAAVRIALAGVMCAAMPCLAHAGKMSSEPVAVPTGGAGSSSSSLERLAAAPGTLRIGEFDVVTGSGASPMGPVLRIETPRHTGAARNANEPKRSAIAASGMLPDAGCATLGSSTSGKSRSTRPEGSAGCW